MDPISVIIRLKNEEQWIGHTIQSVLDHFEHPEIIIINNLSTDKSIQIANLFSHDTSLPFNDKRYTNIKKMKLDEYSPGKAINLGINHSSRKYVLLISAHCVIRKLNKKVLFEKLDVFKAIFGKQIPHYYGKRIKPSYIWSHFEKKETVNMFSELEERYFFHNAFAFFQKEFLEKFPMNEDLVGKEDRYWAHNVVSNGEKYLYDPDFICNHHFTENGNTWRGVG